MVLLPEDPAPVALTQYSKVPEHDCRGPGCVPSQVMRWSYHMQAGIKNPADPWPSRWENGLVRIGPRSSSF
jgi:hypothetical protein